MLRITGETPASKQPQQNSRVGKHKVKSGCRTCKIRKVKCDEAWPACRRCISTGRTCDGYGIWGGGSGFSSKQLTGVPMCNLPLSVLATSIEEKEHFEWFKHRTSTKLPSIFASSFWDTLVFQASSSEPAVLHAVFALSCAHKREVCDGHIIWPPHGIPDKEDQFMLRQYSQAINRLVPYLSTNNKASVRIGLITCVIFISLECLRGRYKTAHVHLHNGLKLLAEITPSSSKVLSSTRPYRDSVDGWIIDTFLQLQVQAALLNHVYGHSVLPMFVFESESLGPTFKSPSQARHHLDRLLKETLHLTEQNQQHINSKSKRQPLIFIDCQRVIQAELVSWLDAYKATNLDLKETLSGRDVFAYRLLHIYYMMDDIMAQTCLSSGNESIFDTHISHFVSIIVCVITLWEMSNSTSKHVAKHRTDGKSIADSGWIPPLYYTAREEELIFQVKCRNHRIRLQAIKLLYFTIHREGIWDAKIAACVARKVMEIEERDFYKDADTADDFHFLSLPPNGNLLLPVLPESYRMHEVQILLPDGPQEKVTFRYKLRRDDGSWESLQTECGWIT